MISKSSDSLELLLHRLRIALKKHNLKNTSQREMILTVMFENEGHHTPEEILKMTASKYQNSNIGMATVYRALNFFEQEQIASSLPLGNESKKFELCTKSHHDHLICTRCNKIEEFFEPKIEAIQAQVAKKSGFALLGHEMQLFGICSECQNKNE